MRKEAEASEGSEGSEPGPRGRHTWEKSLGLTTASKQEDQHLYCPEHLEGWSCHEVGWGGGRTGWWRGGGSAWNTLNLRCLPAIRRTLQGLWVRCRRWGAQTANTAEAQGLQSEAGRRCQ